MYVSLCRVEALRVEVSGFMCRMGDAFGVTGADFLCIIYRGKKNIHRVFILYVSTFHPKSLFVMLYTQFDVNFVCSLYVLGRIYYTIFVLE